MDTTWSCPGLGDMRADSDRCLPAGVPGVPGVPRRGECAGAY
jgi:hypothetical protein